MRAGSSSCSLAAARSGRLERTKAPPPGRGRAPPRQPRRAHGLDSEAASGLSPFALPGESGNAAPAAASRLRHFAQVTPVFMLLSPLFYICLEKCVHHSFSEVSRGRKICCALSLWPSFGKAFPVSTADPASRDRCDHLPETGRELPGDREPLSRLPGSPGPPARLLDGPVQSRAPRPRPPCRFA